tara:strand:+ start:284 stop:1267 length:984 start_codon:yes stop_codon:yes gene_type:complete
MEAFHYLSPLRPPAVNCFFGAVSHCAKFQGYDLAESDVFCLGEGYKLELIFDEYDQPELSYPFYKTIDTMASSLAVRVHCHHLNPENPEEFLLKLLRDYGPFTATVNTSKLPYLKDKYSVAGYTHAVAVCGLKDSLVVLEDFFIGGAKPCSGTIGVSIQNFINSVNEAYAFKQYTADGVFRYIDFSGAPEITNIMRLYHLKRVSSSNLSSEGIQSVLTQHFDCCRRLCAQGRSAKSIFDLLAYDITTDHIVPSRKLLKATLLQLGVLHSELESTIDLAVKSWTLLATSARLYGRTNSTTLDEVEARYHSVCQIELTLWKLINQLDGF